MAGAAYGQAKTAAAGAGGGGSTGGYSTGTSASANDDVIDAEYTAKD